MDTGSPRGSPEGRDPDRASAARTLVRYSTLGFQVVLTFGVLAGAGIWLDRRYQTGPWGTLGGVALGTIALFSTLLREGARKEPGRDPRRRPPPGEDR